MGEPPVQPVMPFSYNVTVSITGDLLDPRCSVPGHGTRDSDGIPTADQ